MMVMRVSEIMPRKITGQRYPDARVKGMMDIFDLIKEEHDWRPNPIDKTTLQTLDIARGKETNALFALKYPKKLKRVSKKKKVRSKHDKRRRA